MEEVRRRDGIVGDGAGARGPFYTSLFLRHKTLSTPPVVQQLKAQTKVSWEVKVFAPILRSAALIDEKCFLWNYETGRDPIMYEASSVITCVDLVKPKNQIFEAHVHYILVICTFTTVELVAVHVKDPHRTEIKLQKLPEYHITTGSTVMQCIATFEPSSPDQNPRIFIGGNDGCVYELQYKEEDGWIRSKMFLQNMSIPGGEVPVFSGLVYMARDWTSNFLGFGGIADLQVDNTRNYLYSLDSKGYVHFWWLGTAGDPTLKQYQCKVHVGSKEAKPVSIHVIPRQKNSDHEILCVLLQDGSRILFSATNTHDGRQRQLQPPRGNYNNDLGSCPVKTFSLLSLQQVNIGPLHPTYPIEQLGHLGNIDDAPGRSFVGAKVSLLIPKNHQTNPQLICTASLGLENSQGNVLSIVDLQPLVRQADTWRKGEIPTTGINIFGVQEEEWAGSSVQTSSSDLITQVVRPPPRFLVAHSAGVTFLTRLRPVDLLHISLFHPQHRDLARQIPGLAHDLKQLDFEWLVATYGKVEVSVMLLTLICSDARPSASQTPQQASSSMAGPIEESIANMLASHPTHTVVQRAQEQLNRMGYAAHAGLFQYFVRAVSSLWSTSFVAPFWEHLWSRKQFSLFVAPLEGLQQYLSQIVSPAGDYQNVWSPSTDMLHDASVVACMIENESFTDIYEMLLPQNNGMKPDAETLKMVEALSRRGLYAVVERTVQALKILRALEDLTAEHRQNIIARIKSMELGRVVSNYSPDESEAFTDALMGELLQLPHGPVDKVWSVWRKCKYFFDPAAVDFYEARKLILSPRSAGNTNVIQEALKRLERPEVAHCLLRRQNNQETANVRLEIICEDLRRGKHYLGAMHLAMLAAKHCDPENRAEDWHMATAEPDALHGVDTTGRADLDQAFSFFNARRIAYNEIMYTLELLCSNDDMDMDCSLNSIRAQRTSAIEWALGPAAAKYFDTPQKGLARPILAGELFKSTDRLLHFHLYTWLICRNDGDGVWPSRCDIQRIRPYRSPQQTVGDSLTQFLSAGHYHVIIKHPLTQWTHQHTHAWTGIWDKWHIGLLNDLADYCESMNEGAIACCVRLTLAHASSAMYQSSSDFGGLGSNLLHARMDVLVKAEASAQRDNSTMGRQLDQWLQSQKPSAVAGVQLEMLQELPHEAWDRRVEQSQEVYAQADQQELQSELVPAPRLYEMLHDSYDESVPHLAIKLLRIMGIERPELKHIFTSTSGVGPWKISDFVTKVIQRHLELIELEDQGSEAIVACFDKLQDAAGIDQGMVHHVMQPFLPLPIVLSGLEEMAMKILEKRGEGLIPEGPLNDPKRAPVSIVPGIVGGVLGWPSSHVLYDGYRMLWTKIEKAQIHDLFPMYAEKDRRAVVARLMAILGQFCLQWLDRHHQDIIHPQSDFAFQQLTREYPVFSGDVDEMALAAEHHVNIPDNVRLLIEDCRRRLSVFSDNINTNQPQGRRRDKW
eukprot:TRINITY_DN8194_c0_g4_i1.p1 TRINITY_DN8194_c0_g4~~TRINITY_DN8194_c0_g4_i1.p1  ORF type:complete len:1520 (+),score=474.87 TRINITY_DN8194_c0_g4_i1:156-4562(+)